MSSRPFNVTYKDSYKDLELISGNTGLKLTILVLVVRKTLEIILQSSILHQETKQSALISCRHYIIQISHHFRLVHRVVLIPKNLHCSIPFVQNISHLGDVPRLKDMCHERALQFTGFNGFGWSFNALSATLMSFSFFNGNESKSDSRDFGKPQSRSSGRDLFDGRQWTNVLLAANVL